MGRLGVVLTIPVVLATGPLVGYVVGSAIDERWQTASWAMGVGVIVGGLGSCVQVYRILRWVAQHERKASGRP